LATLATQEGYFTFYLVSLAVKQGLVEIVGNHPIPEGLEAPSALRRSGFTTPEGKVLTWVVWDGAKEVLKKELTAQEKRFSLAEMWNHEFLVSRLSEQWRPEHETGAPAPVPSEDKLPEEPISGGALRMHHYLYFPRAKEGKAVAAGLRQRGFTVESRKSADGKSWLVLARHALSPEDPTGGSVREGLERLAQQHSGQYDGHETEVPE
jgi:hypothetical protein